MTKISRKSLNEFILETETKLSQIILQAEQKLTGIDNDFVAVAEIKGNSQVELGAIQQIKTDVNTILTELQQYHEKFIELKARLEDEDDGLEANFALAKLKAEEIEGVKNSSEEELKLIEKIKKQSEELQGKILEYEKLTTGYKEKIQQTYNFMNGQGLAHSFYERKTEIDSAMTFWRRSLIASTLLLIGLIVWIFIKPPEFLNEIKDVTSWLHLVSYLAFRLFLFSPLIFAIWYSSIQYSKERSEIAQYAFKGGVAKALENYTDLLTDKFQDKKGENEVRDKILEFTISCMKDIYQNPNIQNKEDSGDFDWNPYSSKKEIEKFNKVIVGPMVKTVNKMKSVAP